MPKLKVKPTPAQARLLKVLFDNENIIVSTSGHYQTEGGGWSRTTYALERQMGKPRASTVDKCIKEGWLEPTDPGKYPDLRQFMGYKFRLSEAGKAWASQLTTDDLISTNRGVSTRHILDVLKRRHPSPDWIFAEEVRMGTAWGSYYVQGMPKSISYGQRIDAFAMHCWPSKKFERIAYEVKIHRGDFKKELDDPYKREAAMYFANFFMFAAPEGLIKPHEVPEGCGLIEVRGDGHSNIRVPAMYQESNKPFWPFVASLSRALMKG